MTEVDFWYAQLLRRLLDHGESLSTRNSDVRRLRFDDKADFGYFATSSTPLISLRNTAWKNCLREWEWFQSGSNFAGDLHPKVQSWWEPWEDNQGYIFGNYSVQLRRFSGSNSDGLLTHCDQITELVAGIRDHPYSRRHVITTWHPVQMRDRRCPITNCHTTVTQCYVDVDDRLHMETYQRSVDTVCGLPHNLLQTWAFLLWLAAATNRKVGQLLWRGGDIHLYEEHATLATELLGISDTFSGAELDSGPQLFYTGKPGSDFKADDFTLSKEYQPLSNAKAKMIV